MYRPILGADIYRVTLKLKWEYKWLKRAMIIFKKNKLERFNSFREQTIYKRFRNLKINIVSH
jgi:hypothetical protein